MKASARNVHYVLGLSSVVFLLTSAVTGLLWAYAPYLYWHPNYMQKRSSTPSPDPATVPIDLAGLIKEARAETGSAIGPEEVLLRSSAGRLLLELRFQKSQQTILYDAAEGRRLSPLSAELAAEFAAEYVAGEPALQSATLHSPWFHRKGAKHDSAWVLRFADEPATEIVIDAFSGAILEDSDSVRRFHFQVMDLHQFNFFGTKKVLSAVSGVPLLILGVTGTVIGWKRFRAKRRRKPAPAPRKLSGIKAVVREQRRA